MYELTIASHLAVFSSYVAAMIGTDGRSLDILRAVLPLVVKAMMAFDFEISATLRRQDDGDMRMWWGRENDRRGGRKVGWGVGKKESRGMRKRGRRRKRWKDEEVREGITHSQSSSDWQGLLF